MMKFKVVGTNIKTSARMVIEVEAHNRAAAERAATQAGVEVLHVEHISEDPLDGVLAGAEPRKTRRGEHEPESRRAAWIALVAALILIVAAVAVYRCLSRAGTEHTEAELLNSRRE